MHMKLVLYLPAILLDYLSTLESIIHCSFPNLPHVFWIWCYKAGFTTLSPYKTCLVNSKYHPNMLIKFCWWGWNMIQRFAFLKRTKSFSYPELKVQLNQCHTTSLHNHVIFDELFPSSLVFVWRCQEKLLWKVNISATHPKAIFFHEKKNLKLYHILRMLEILSQQ